MHSVPKLLPVEPARAWRSYIGGAQLDELHGCAKGEGVISNFPEEWILSVVEAKNAGREDISEGLSYFTQGGSLRDLIKSNPAKWLGQAHVDKIGAHIGMLVKLIDAQERLTIQVHPTKEAAKTLFDSNYGKTECWHILSTKEVDGQEACVYIGFKEGITAQKWKALFDTQDIEGMLACLHKVVVQPGDTIFVEGGMPHAIGAGCFLVEIQEPTDYTIRIERVTPAGLTVPDGMCHQGLGFDKMMDCFVYQGFTEQALREKVFLPACPTEQLQGATRVCFTSTPKAQAFFGIDEITVTGRYTFAQKDVFSGLYLLEGAGVYLDQGETKVMEAPQQYFLPAGSAPIEVVALPEKPMRILQFFGPR